MINVLIVDDSLTIRKKIAEIVESDPDLTVAAEAKNGHEAFEMTKSLSPEVVVMDLVMPNMDGQEATELIMAYHPTPIIIHSSAANRGENYKTMDALSAGALDYLEKNSANWEDQLLSGIKRASRIKVVTHLKKRRKQNEEPCFVCTCRQTPYKYNLLIIGASTGGPRILLDIICRLPKNFPIPVIVAMHMDESFGDSMCDWLNNNSSLNVKIPQNGDPLIDIKGTVYLAPPEKHLLIENLNLKFSLSPPVNFCRPSIDVLFKSAADNQQFKTIGVLLTGMGQDGAYGLKDLKNSGGYTIAQDKSTSIVFGMPKKAIEIGAATSVLSSHQIPDEIIKLVCGDKK